MRELNFKLFFEEVSRRDFLKMAGATGLSALTGSNAQADNTDYSRMPVNKEAKPDEEFEYLSYLLYPRTQEEKKQLEEFYKYTYVTAVNSFGSSREEKDLRTTVFSNLSQPKERLESEYKRFLMKYTGGKTPVPIKYKGDTTGTAGFLSQDEIRYSKDQVDKLNYPPSMVVRHEIDHIRQGDRKVDVISGSPESQIRESLAALYDIASVVLIDQNILSQQGKSIFKDEEGNKRYSTPIKFPSGTTITVGQLANMAKAGGLNVESKNPESAMKLWAKYAKFIEALIYGHNRKVHPHELQTKEQKQPPEFYIKKYREMYKAKYPEWVKFLKEFFSHPNDKKSLMTKEGINVDDEASLKAAFEKKRNNMSHQKLVYELGIKDDPYFAFPDRGFEAIPRQPNKLPPNYRWNEFK